MNAEHILVAVDFGPTSARAFQTAVDLAKRLGTSLDIVNVSPPMPIEAQEAVGTAPYADAAHEEMAKLAAAANAQGVTAKTHLRMETVVFGLLQSIEELKPQFVIIGSHGRRGVSRALLGSISESLARRSPVPVLIVPSPERHEKAQVAAWCCSHCGHILNEGEPTYACSRCGKSPADWLSAPVTGEPVDAGDPAVGIAPTGEDIEAPQAQSSGGGFFATAPGGFDRSETNAEIRIRRF